MAVAVAERPDVKPNFEDWVPLLVRVAQHFTTYRPVIDTDEYSDACLGWINAIRSWDGVRPFKTHLWTCARRAIIDGIRVRANQRRGEFKTEDMDFSVVDQESHLQEWLSFCPVETRGFLEEWLYGKTFEEIAVTHDMSERQIRYRVKVAIDFIAKRLGHELQA